jgi:hypothetical protein
MVLMNYAEVEENWSVLMEHSEVEERLCVLLLFVVLPDHADPADL